MKIQDILDAQNVAEKLDNDHLKDIARDVVQSYKDDKESRSEWETRMEGAYKLAMQVTQKKSTPWENASNVKFPLLTIAALQFQSRAYPALVSGPRIVDCATVGDDPDGLKLARAERVSQHMSYQILVEDEGWEEEHDRALMVLPIMGTVFKKSYYDPIKERNVSEMVLPHDLVLPYYGKFDTLERKTHVLRMTPRVVKERMLSGLWLDMDLSTPIPEEEEGKADKGFNPTEDKQTPRKVLEQHRYLDLDDDGYEEPYVVTVDLQDEKVLRIVARFSEEGIHRDTDKKAQVIARQAMLASQNPQLNMAERTQLLKDSEAEAIRVKNSGKIIRIEPIEHFTKYPFIPSPDGGIYDLGFGALLGPVNDAVDTILNQLIDAGTLQNSSSGFLGRGARIKGGHVRFKPFEWKKVDVPGPSLRENIVPVPVNPPSPVLFSLLNLLINYGERIASVTDMMVGETPGQNTPATTSMAALDQGMKVFTGIFKRVFRAQTREFRKLYKLNSLYLDPQKEFRVIDTVGVVYRDDYRGDPTDITPSADPNIISEVQRVKQAEFLAQRAASVPGYNKVAVELRLLQTMQVSGIQKIFPTDPKGNLLIQPQPDPIVELKTAGEHRKTIETQAKVAKTYHDMGMSVDEMSAKLANLTAQAELFEAQAEAAIGAQEMEEIKTHIMQLETIMRVANEARANNGMEGQPGNAGVLPASSGPTGQAPTGQS